MKYFLCLLYILLLKNGLAQAQTYEVVVKDASYMCNNSANYIPYQPQYTPLKVLRLVVHVFGKDDGSGNLPDSPEGHAFLESVFNHLKWYYKDPVPLEPHAANYNFIPDTRLRFHIDTILFHRDNDAWNFKKYVVQLNQKTKDSFYSNSAGMAQANSLYHKYVENNNEISIRQKDSALHIFLLEAPGQANKGMAESINTKRWVYALGTYEFYEKGKNHWDPGALLAHEIGHALGLVHPFDFEQCADLPVTKKGLTNNIVDTYPNAGRAFSPCQIGIIHFNLSNPGRIGDAVIRDWCFFHPDSVTNIPAGDTVFFNGRKHFLGDVYIAPGAVLVVRCTLSLPAGASVYIAEKGKLIINGGTITNVCGQKWNGIMLEKRSKFLGIFTRKSKSSLEIFNNGKIENAEKNESEIIFE